MRISDWSSDVCSSDLCRSRACSSVRLRREVIMGRHDARVFGQRSAFAHALGGLGCGAGANLLLDAATDVGIDILPIGKRLAQDRLADAAQKAAGDLIDQLRPLRIVEDRKSTRLNSSH